MFSSQIAVTVRRQLHYVREYHLYRFFLFNENLIWLASFPCSGNTWIRLMLHELLISGAGGETEIRKTIPDIHRNWDILNLKQAKTPFAKTHFPHQDAYRKVVYILRDPVDTLHSLWQKLSRKYANFELSLDDFIDREIDEGWLYGRWDTHALSYLNSNPLDSLILILRYEEIVADPVDALRRILEFADIKPDSVQLSNVAINHMDNLLASNDVQYSSYAEKTQAVTALQVKKGYSQMSSDQIKRIQVSSLGRVAKELGYL